MSEKRLKRVMMALKVLNRDKELKEILLNLGVSSQDLRELVEQLTPDLQVPILLLDTLDKACSRVFSLWEQAFLSKEAREFLLAALHTKALTRHELEQALALLFAQLQGFADVEEVREVLAHIVQDTRRTAMFAVTTEDYIH